MRAALLAVLLAAGPLRAQSPERAAPHVFLPPWLAVFVDAPRGAYPLALCVATDRVDTAHGLVIEIDSVSVAAEWHHADCLSRPLLYVRPSCELLEGERESFEHARAEYLVILCGGGRIALLIRHDAPRRATP